MTDLLHRKAFLTENKSSKVGQNCTTTKSYWSNPSSYVQKIRIKKKPRTSWIYEDVEALESRKDKADVVKIGKLESNS